MALQVACAAPSIEALDSIERAISLLQLIDEAELLSALPPCPIAAQRHILATKLLTAIEASLKLSASMLSEQSAGT